MDSGIVHRLFVAAIVATVGACGHRTEADEDMNAELDRVFDGASALDRDLDAHANAVSSATDLGMIEAAEATHGTMMASHMDGVDHVLSDMTMFCRHRASEERGRTHEMQGAMTDMRSELERHRQAPRPDIAAARAEEDKHLGQSRAVLNRLRDVGAAMRHEAGFYRCAHGMH